MYSVSFEDSSTDSALMELLTGDNGKIAINFSACTRCRNEESHFIIDTLSELLNESFDFMVYVHSMSWSYTWTLGHRRCATRDYANDKSGEFHVGTLFDVKQIACRRLRRRPPSNRFSLRYDLTSPPSPPSASLSSLPFSFLLFFFPSFFFLPLSSLICWQPGAQPPARPAI